MQKNLSVVFTLRAKGGVVPPAVFNLPHSCKHHTQFFTRLAAYYDISTFGLENSTLQDMLLSFQQDLNLTESELKRANEENRRLRQVLPA
jgi:hypothetical protein